MLVGKTALIVIDIQKGAGPAGEPSPIPLMSGAEYLIPNARAIIAAARAAEVPVIFIQEAHRPSLVDFGRELDGIEGVHCLESEPQTEISGEIGFRPDDLFIRKRRYSAFFGTELAILLKGVKAETLVLIGGLTDVCVHYTFVDAHQSDFLYAGGRGLRDGVKPRGTRGIAERDGVPADGGAADHSRGVDGVWGDGAGAGDGVSF